MQLVKCVATSPSPGCGQRIDGSAPQLRRLFWRQQPVTYLMSYFLRTLGQAFQPPAWSLRFLRHPTESVLPPRREDFLPLRGAARGKAAVGRVLENLCRKRPLDQVHIIIGSIAELSRRAINDKNFDNYIYGWIRGHFIPM
jgi:hypothetical protein